MRNAIVEYRHIHIDICTVLQKIITHYTECSWFQNALKCKRIVSSYLQTISHIMYTSKIRLYCSANYEEWKNKMKIAASFWSCYKSIIEMSHKKGASKETICLYGKFVLLEDNHPQFCCYRGETICGRPLHSKKQIGSLLSGWLPIPWTGSETLRTFA